MPDKTEEQPLVSRTGLVVVGLLSVCFFALMFFVLSPHVPSHDPTAVKIVAGMSAACMTGVFWIASNMFLVTLVDHLRRNKGK